MVDHHRLIRTTTFLTTTLRGGVGLDFPHFSVRSYEDSRFLERVSIFMIFLDFPQAAEIEFPWLKGHFL